WHFTRCGEAEQSETARSGSGRQSPKHYSIRTEQAYTDWTRRFIVFHTKQNNGVWRDPREATDVKVSEFLTYFKASVRQFHTSDVCSRIERTNAALTLPAGVWMDRWPSLVALEWRRLLCREAPSLAPHRPTPRD